MVLLFAISLLFACKGENHTAHSEKTEFTCPMHPGIIKNEPGSCPICGMDLVAKKSSHGKADDSLALIIKPTNSMVLSAIKTVKPQRGSRFGEVQARGVINYNTNNSNSISARVSGRIERLYVKYNYQAVSKGQKLMDIYSPDLTNAQQELLFLRDNNEPQLLESAKKKLRLLGASEQQINQVIKSGKISSVISIFSPYAGYVSEIQQAAGSVSSASAGNTVISAAGNSDGMSMGAASATAPSAPEVASNNPIQLREGQYVSAGQRLFSFVNSGTVWAEFYVRPENLDLYKKGNSIEIRSADVETKATNVKVSLIQPYYNQGTKYSLVRAVIPNAGNAWKVGELINVSPGNTKENGTWLPRTAVLQLGTRYVSFVKKDRAFVPVYVNVKSITGDWVDIGESLNSDVEVAANSWFLVDTESFIKVEKL